MNIAIATLEEVELSISPEDLPNFRLSKDADINDDATIKEQTPLEAARNFIVDLQKGLREKKEDDLFYLYDRKFNKICEIVFKTAPWPTVEEIEENDEELEFDMNTMFLYNELCFRHIFARIPNVEPDVRMKSFQNYIDLFETFLHTKDDVVLPVPWIWDILDEFLYQFHAFCQYRAKMREDDSNLEFFLNDLDNVPTLEKVTEILNSLIASSGVIKSGKNELEDISAKTGTRQYFGYYSIVCLLRLNVLCCDYAAALKAIEPIDFRRLQIFTKALSCLLTLFYYAGIAYLMSQRYRESVKLFELILSCFSKYKQFYSKSFQHEAMSKLADRSLSLLGIALAFYPTTIDESIANSLKDRFGDRLTKMNKYDINAFNDSFNYGSPKLIIPIKDKEHFRDYGYEKNIMEIVNQEREILTSEFTKIQELNNLRGVLKLYNTIKLSKLAAVLNKDQNQLQELIALFRARYYAEPKQNPFEQTVIKKLLDSIPTLEFTIEGDTVKTKTVVIQPNYSKLFYKNINKIEDITREIQAL